MLSRAFFRFFDELALNMNREWFRARKSRFTADVLEPFTQLTRHVLEKVRRDYDPRVETDPRKAMFRIYRDTRFSADKSPYKLWMGAVVSAGGRKNDRYPEMYFQFGQQINFVAGGLYRPSREVLVRIREAIAADPERLDAINRDPRLREFFPGGLLGDRNKRLPRKEWMEKAHRQPFILNKQFYTYKEISRAQVLRPDLDLWLARHFGAMQTWNDFLNDILE